jgi:hypothetical protein
MSAEPEVASATLKRSLNAQDPATNGRLKRVKSEESPAQGRVNGAAEVCGALVKSTQVLRSSGYAAAFSN